MKKLLSLLATVSLVSTSTASIVACGNGNNDPIDENEDDNTDDQEKDISTIISVTDLGDINFYSLTGNDVQTRTEIIDQVRTLNPSAGIAQINISNINPMNGTATISVVGFSGSLTVAFTVLVEAEAEPISISFPSTPNSMTQLQDGTILVVGGISAATSFLATVDLSNSQIQILADGSTNAFPSTLWSIIQLDDGTIFVTGGASAATSFLVSVDLSNTTNPVQILAQGAFPSAPRSIIELQDSTILVASGNVGLPPFLSLVDLSDPADPQIQTVVQSLDAFPSMLQSITQLDDGTILVAGGTNANGSNSFLASVDLSNPDNPQTQILPPGSAAFPSVPRSITQLQNGTILVTGGATATSGSDSFLALVDLSDPDNSQIQILAQGPFPSIPRSITELQDGTILVTGGAATTGANSFLRII